MELHNLFVVFFLPTMRLVLHSELKIMLPLTQNRHLNCTVWLHKSV